MNVKSRGKISKEILRILRLAAFYVKWKLGTV